MRPRLLVFDLDGTLLDTVEDIALHLGSALLAVGRPAPSVAAVRGWVGDGVSALVRRALGDDDEATVGVVIADYRARYAADPTPATRLMQGAAALLEALPPLGVRAAVCTNKPGALARAIVARTFPAGTFDVVVGEGDAARAKPHPDLVLAALGAIAPADAWMIGDGPQDVLAARAANVRAIAVMNGYGDAAALAAAMPDQLVPDLTEVRRSLSSAPAGSR